MERIIREKQTIATWDLNAFRDLIPKLLDEDDQLQMLTSQVNQGRPNSPKPNRNPPQWFQPKNKIDERNGTMAFPIMTNETVDDAFEISSDNQNLEEQPTYNNRYRWPCPFCGENHRAKFCLLTPHERTLNLVQCSQCILCFKKGHWPHDCDAEPCRICNGPHHTFVCIHYISPDMRNTNNYGQTETNEDQPYPSDQDNEYEEQSNEEEQEDEETPTDENYYNKEDRHTIINTTIVSPSNKPKDIYSLNFDNIGRASSLESQHWKDSDGREYTDDEIDRWAM